MQQLGGIIGQAMAEKKQFRAQIPPDIDFLVKAIAPLKNAGRDWSVGDIATEALREWLLKPENRELIKAHSLMDALERSGMQSDLFGSGSQDDGEIQ